MVTAGIRRWGVGFASGAFAVALALLLVLVLRSIAVQISPPPSPLSEAYPDVSTQEKCDAEGGRWVVQPIQEGVGRPAPAPVTVDEKFQSYCQGPLKFEREREIQREQSQQTSLFVFALGGGLAVVGGVFLRGRPAVAPGLMLGGIASFFIAGIHVWMLSPGFARLVTIVAVFVVLLGVGLFAFRDEPGESLPPAHPPAS